MSEAAAELAQVMDEPFLMSSRRTHRTTARSALPEVTRRMHGAPVLGRHWALQRTANVLAGAACSPLLGASTSLQQSAGNCHRL